MSTTTTNYGLIKPELSDAANITATNENWDKIDTELSKLNNVRVTPITKGGTGATTADEALANSGGARTATFDVTVPVSWVEDTTNGGYKQIVAVTGITANDNPIVDIVLGNSAEVNKTHLKAWGCVDRITTANGSITLYAYSKAPETAFNIQLKVVR